MIHPFRDKKRIARRKSVIKMVVFTGVFVLVSVSGVLAWTSGFFQRIGFVVWEGKRVVSEQAQNAGYVIRTKASVFRENQKITQENTDLKNAMLDYQILRNENEALKELFKRTPESHTYVLATIIAKPSQSLYDTIIVDAGRAQHIVEGQKVFVNGSTPIGEVVNVYDKTSLVMLYSNPGQITNAMLDGSNVSVELVGRGGGNFEMMIPLDLSSDKGTFVILPGLQSEILAVVEEIISAPTDPLKKVLLKSPINIQGLKWVQIRKQ